LIVGDRSVDGVFDSCNLREVAYSETFARGAANNVVSWVFVGIGRLLSAGFDDFKDGVDTKSLMRVDWLTFPVSNGLGKVVGVNAPREKLGAIVVNGLVIRD